MQKLVQIKAFFGCAMRGGRLVVSREELIQLKDAIRGLGIEFVSEHQTQANIIAKEDECTVLEIHDQDWDYRGKEDSRHVGPPFACFAYTSTESGRDLVCGFVQERICGSRDS